MVLYTKAKPPIKDTMARVDLPTQMETFTKVNGLMEKLMVMDALLKFMTGLFMMENGTWMLCMEKESFSGISENANTKEILKMDKELEMEFTERELKHTPGKLKMGNFMEKDNTFSIIPNQTRRITKSSTKVNSKTIKS